MSHHRRADGDPPDDLSYEDFDDDFVWHDPDDDLDVIDLDALDDPITDDEQPPDEDTETGPDTDAESTEDAEDDVARTTARMMQTLIERDQSARQPSRPAPQPEPETEAEAESALEAESKPGPESTNESAPVEEEADEAGKAAETAPETVEPDETTEDTPDDATASEDETPADAPQAGVAEAEVAAVEAAAAETTAETAPETEATAPASTDAAAEEPSEPPPDWVYHVLIALPDELAARVLELRAAGEVEDMPLPGIALAGSFRMENVAAVEEQLARWARNHLPLQIEITGIVAEVIGAQDYLAAWSLQPEEELTEAQHNLRRAVATLIEPLPGARPPLTVNLVIGDRVPAGRYPHLIGRMQRDFEPYVWHATDLLLVRKDADADDGAWEVTQQYD